MRPPNALRLVATAAFVTGCLTTPASAAPAPRATSVQLVTGDRVTLTGRSSFAVNANTPAQSYQDSSGDRFVVPLAVTPYLGHQLDPALFDVSALVRDGLTDRVPVTLAYAPGVAPTAPPGVTSPRSTARPRAGT